MNNSLLDHFLRISVPAHLNVVFLLFQYAIGVGNYYLLSYSSSTAYVSYDFDQFLTWCDHYTNVLLETERQNVVAENKCQHGMKSSWSSSSAPYCRPM